MSVLTQTIRELRHFLNRVNTIPPQLAWRMSPDDFATLRKELFDYNEKHRFPHQSASDVRVLNIPIVVDETAPHVVEDAGG